MASISRLLAILEQKQRDKFITDRRDLYARDSFRDYFDPRHPFVHPFRMHLEELLLPIVKGLPVEFAVCEDSRSLILAVRPDASDEVADLLDDIHERLQRDRRLRFVESVEIHDVEDYQALRRAARKGTLRPTPLG